MPLLDPISALIQVMLAEEESQKNNCTPTPHNEQSSADENSQLSMLKQRTNLRATDTGATLELLRGELFISSAVLNSSQSEFSRYLSSIRPALNSNDVLALKGLRRRWQNLHHSEVARRKRRALQCNARDAMQSVVDDNHTLLDRIVEVAQLHFPTAPASLLADFRSQLTMLISQQ